jgi:glycosyltransferase involved in cell wall biosynthesis
MKKVSIIIPVYNIKDYVADCIESVISQDYRNIQIIIVDDGSSDGSEGICDEYALKDERITVIHKKNEGVSCARNDGIKAADGDYIYFLDGDDMLVPDAIGLLVNEIEKDACDAVMFEAVKTDEDSLGTEQGYFDKNNDYTGIHDGKRLFAELKKNNEYTSCAVLLFIRRSSLSISFDKIVHEDELFTPEFLYSIKNISYIPKQLYIRRIRPDSITTKKKSAVNFRGMSRVIYKLQDVKNIDEPLVKHICDLYRTVDRMYSWFEPEEKKAVRTEKKALDTFFLDRCFRGEKRFRKMYRHAVLSKIYHHGSYKNEK